jgi:hypothetical protein
MEPSRGFGGAVVAYDQRVCEGAGNLPSCQLCPNSLTYWRLSDPPPPPDPDAHGLTAPDPVGVDYEFILTQDDGWSQARAWKPQPCVMCTKPAMMLSPKGVPCHRVCAEDFNKARGRRRSTLPESGQGQI